MNLTVIPNEKATSRGVVCRTRRHLHFASGTERRDDYGEFCNDGSETRGAGKILTCKLLGTLALGVTLGVLGLGQIGAMFWLFELAAFIFVGFIPGLLLL